MPVEFERVLNKATEKNRDLRYQHASEIRTDLKRLQRDTHSARSPSALAEQASVPKPAWRRRSALIAAVVIALAIAAAAFFHFRRTPVLTEKDSIVVADFTNTTGDSVFDGTLSRGLSAQLEQSPFLKVVSGSQIVQTLRLMEQPPDAHLTQQLAQEVCLRADATTVIEGSISCR